MWMQMNRPADAKKYFAETSIRTQGRPKAIYGIARAAEMLGDMDTAAKRYAELLALWRNADNDRLELTAAKQYLAKATAGPG